MNGGVKVDFLALTVENFPQYRSDFCDLLQENMQEHIDSGACSMEYCNEKTDEIPRYLSEGRAVVFLAIESGKTCGLVWGYPRCFLNQNQLFLQLIQVHPEVRSTGVGASLIRNFEDYAFHHGYTHIELIANADNFSAHSFYEREGYTATRIHYAKEVTHE